MPEIDLLGIHGGSVIAPAGYGKTQCIVDSVAEHTGAKPVLILTHTNAGVYALQHRLRSAGARNDQYRLGTIDGWSRKLVQTFPGSSEYEINPTTAPDYAATLTAAINTISNPGIQRILRGTYSHLLVDEYQDCSLAQHNLVRQLAEQLPTCVLGDPLQAIFDIGGTVLADWGEHVATTFPHTVELETPWRWRNAGADALGEWLVHARQQLLVNAPIDLHRAPGCVTFHPTGGPNTQRAIDNQVRFAHRNDDGRLLIIDSSAATAVRQRRAARCQGVSLVESVDLAELREVFRRLDDGADLGEATLEIARTCMTRINDACSANRLRSLRSGSARSAASQTEQAVLDIADARSAAVALRALADHSDTRVYRWGQLGPAIESFNLYVSGRYQSYVAAFTAQRELARVSGRSLPRRALGSTLLLKGLEAENVLVLDAHRLSSRHLYVALSRASQRLTICGERGSGLLG